MILTLRLDKGNYATGSGRLLAHEIGHLMGSDHDGTPPLSSSLYGRQGHRMIEKRLVSDTSYIFILLQA